MERPLEPSVNKEHEYMDPMILACVGVVTALVIGFVVARGKRA